jgi:AAA domain
VVGTAANPVLNAVEALLHHHPGVPRRSLPVSRRLDWRGAPPVREAFYPGLAFGPVAEAGSRELQLRSEHPVWSRAAETGWAYVELPERQTQQVDGELIQTIADLVAELLAYRPRVFDERSSSEGRLLTQDRVAVGVSHRNQRAALSIALQERGLSQVAVDTANRLQGREFDVLVAAHPLSGRSDASAFHLDAGRLCVLASRHRQCCVFVGRAGAARLLADYPPPGHTILGASKDTELDGWEAHARFLEHLESSEAAA